MLSIGQLSKQTGVKVPTIRYYEQQGLIEQPHRSAGNQRRYEPATLNRLRFIKHARDLGINIDSIRQLIDLSTDPDKPCHEADEIARQHLAEIRAKITNLLRLEKELLRISTRCSGERVGECYVIQSLSDHGLCLDEH
ncbi:MAG TPA: MerR family transcriptional regulator [Rhizobiales bacterium]|nr:MerR family transcriptional regulator [Hyphomicrobiales bacterium]